MNAVTPKVLLHPQHKAFADKYILTGNGAESAREAGYAQKNAGVQANRLLKRPDIQAYIAQQTEKLSNEQDDLQSKVIQELKDMAFANIGSFIQIVDGKPVVDFSGATEAELKAIASVKNKTSKRFDREGKHIGTYEESAFVLADKYRGLELLGKHLGLFKADEQRVVLDVADRLLAARNRLRALGASESES